MDAKNPGRNVRDSASIPIHVAWTTQSGGREAVEARIVRISPSGATIVLPSKLNDAQEITIRKVVGGDETAARVVGLISEELDWRIYGVVFIDPAPTVSERLFPPASDSATSQPRLFLECASCLSRALVTLNEIQAEVFAARGLVVLSCKRCHSWTVWALASHDISPGPTREGAAGPAPAPALRTKNRRKHSRIHSMAMACVRYSGVTEEVVRVKDASRGGFRFVSPNHYIEGSNISVAMPFTRDASNIFVPAKIIWRRELPRLQKLEYGVAYLKP